ncbi:MAG TPA: transcriptional regulator, partial [Firmicutes bacterium]|nr:transcriptional regulator [Bacillota bacterium]
MDDLNNIIWKAGLAELKQGYIYEPPSGEYVCLVCGARFCRGRIYPVAENLYEAQKAAEIHMQQEHGSMFAFLLAMDKKYTGLTEHQKAILTAFFQGQNDKEIALMMDNGNTSTIRNQRFAFRERAKQAKIFLAIMELLEDHLAAEDQFVEIPRKASMVDERYAIT